MVVMVVMVVMMVRMKMGQNNMAGNKMDFSGTMNQSHE
jgi:hypothetical protein